MLLSFAYLSPLPENIPCDPEVSPKTGWILLHMGECNEGICYI